MISKSALILTSFALDDVFLGPVLRGKLQYELWRCSVLMASRLSERFLRATPIYTHPYGIDSRSFSTPNSSLVGIMFSSWRLHALPSSLLLTLLIAFYPSTAATTCSQELALTGYPSCANSCFSICDKYCPSSNVDLTCACRTGPYIQEIFSCLKKACPRADLVGMVTINEAACKVFGYDISQYISASASSAGTTATGVPASASSGASTSTSGSSTGGNAGGSGGGVPVSTVVGIAVGLGVPFLIAIGILLYCLGRRRKQRAAQATAQPAVVEVAHPPKQEATHRTLPPPQPQFQPQYPTVYTSPGQYQEISAAQGAAWPSHAPMEIEGNAPGNAPGWRAPHEMG